MQANQSTPTSTVYRSRFFSATEEPVRLEETPPPNMLDRPPPLPRCRRISRVSRMLVVTSSVISVYANQSMAARCPLQWLPAIDSPPRIAGGPRRPSPVPSRRIGPGRAESGRVGRATAPARWAGAVVALFWGPGLLLGVP